MKWFCTILFSFIVLVASAQVKFDVKLSDKHAQKVAKTKDVRKKLKKYKKLMDKEERKARKAYLDSMEQVALNRAPIDSSFFQVLPDSASVADSLSWALNTLAASHQTEELAMLTERLQELDSGDFQVDSLELTPLAEELVQEQLSSYTSGLDLPQDNLMDVVQAEIPTDEISQLKSTASEAQSMAEDPQAKIDQLQEKVKGDQLAKLQQKMAKLKDKYVSIPDLSKPEEGIKRNSLKGKPLIDRLILTGNVSIQSTDPIIPDIDIKLGYQINKKLQVGGGIRWRELIGKRDSASLAGAPTQMHGYSLFAEQEFFRGAFLHAEYAQLRNTTLFGEQDPKVSWQQEYLLGIGRKFQIASYGSISTTILYDFNHRNNDTHPRPFVVRVGFSLNGLPWGK